MNDKYIFNSNHPSHSIDRHNFAIMLLKYVIYNKNSSGVKFRYDIRTKASKDFKRPKSVKRRKMYQKGQPLGFIGTTQSMIFASPKQPLIFASKIQVTKNGTLNIFDFGEFGGV